jgi:hypothetical protein
MLTFIIILTTLLFALLGLIKWLCKVIGLQGGFRDSEEPVNHLVSLQTHVFAQSRYFFAGISRARPVVFELAFLNDSCV